MNALIVAKSVRSLGRIRHIASVLTQHGFGHFVDRLNLRRFAPLRLLRGPKYKPDPDPRLSVGQRLAQACNALGPTFIKVGQFASTRPDLLPADVIEPLSALQDRVAPFPTDQALGIIADEFGEPVETLFKEFDRTPIASGSIGQVYRAVTAEGRRVVVKVKRPDVDDTVRHDLFLMRGLAEAIEQYVPELRIYRPSVLLDEFETVLLQELDFTNEAANGGRLQTAFADDDLVRIPSTIWELSGPRVLTQEEIPGENLTRLLSADGAGLNRPQLAERLADCYLKQFFEVGLYHADPHPGNIMIEAPSNIGLIDFGQVGVVGDRLAGDMLSILSAVIHQEVDFGIDVLSDMGAIGTETDTRALARELQLLDNKYHGLPLARIDLVAAFHEWTMIMRRHEVEVPRELLMVVKTLCTVFGTVLRLDPKFDVLGVLQPRLRRLMRERLSPRRLGRTATFSGWHMWRLFRDGPVQLRTALRRASKGEWKLSVHHHRLDQLLSELDRSSNRLSFSIVIAAIVVGSSLVVTTDPQVTVFGIPLHAFAIAGYLFAAILGMGLLWAIFRSGRLS